MAIELLNEDCMAVMARYPDKHFDLAIVDPPYGINMDNQKIRTKPNRPNTYKRAGQSQYVESEWDNQIPNKRYFFELYRISKNQIIWGANYFCEHLKNGFGWIFWDKQMGDNSFSAGEFAYKSFGVKSDMVSIPSMRVQNTRIHPTQKPVKLYEWLLTNYAKPGQKILDTHGGSMSIAIACHNLGFDLVCTELDADYYQAAVKRYNNHILQQKLF